MHLLACCQLVKTQPCQHPAAASLQITSSPNIHCNILLVKGAQRLTDHLQDALRDLADVRQQENDLLKRRVELCHQELDDQVAQLERSFQLKVFSSSHLPDALQCCGGICHTKPKQLRIRHLQANSQQSQLHTSPARFKSGIGYMCSTTCCIG